MLMRPSALRSPMALLAVGKQPLFFITSGASSAALEEANDMGVSIIRFDFIQPQLHPMNEVAKELLKKTRFK